jgi:hypothetical protein
VASPRYIARAIVLLASCAFFAPAASAATVEIVTQSREVEADLEISGLFSATDHDGPYTAGDAGPFRATATAQSLAAPGDFVSASQTSSLSIAPTGAAFHGDGGITLNLPDANSLLAFRVEAESRINVVFDVLDPQQYELTAVFVEPRRSITLSGPGGTATELGATGTQTGTLTAGQYTLDFPLIMPISQFSSPTTFNTTYDFDLTLTPVPEPVALAVMPLVLGGVLLFHGRRPCTVQHRG